MKILFITNNFPPIMCGVGDHTFCFAKELSSQGHEISVVCKNDKRIIQGLKDIPSAIQVFPTIDRWDATAVEKISDLVTYLQPNWIVLQYTPFSYHKYGVPIFLFKLLKLLRKKTHVAIFFHEVRMKMATANIKRIVNAIPIRYVSKRLFSLAHLNITSNQGYQRLLSKTNDPKSHIIRIGSNIPMVDSNESEVGLLKESLFGKETSVIGSFGMGVRGLPVVLDSFKALCEERKDVALLLIGGIKAEIVKQIEDFKSQNQLQGKIIVSGYLPSEQVASYMALLDIYLMLEPSHSSEVWTGTSTRSGTLATAMGLGKPVIGTRGELTDDFFRNKENIFLLDTLSKDSLKAGIIELLNDPKLRLKLSLESKKSYQQELDWHAAGKKLVGLFSTNSN